MDYNMIIDMLICTDEEDDMECKVGVVVKKITHGTYDRNEGSDIDFYGSIDYDFDVLDMDEVKRPDLYKYVTDTFQELLHQKINEQLQ